MSKTFVALGSKLLSPLKMGDLTLANRVVLAPLTRGRSGLSGVPNDALVQYYSQRASAGLVITEATSISEQAHGWYGAAACYTQEHADGWKKVTDAVHSKGGKIFVQLWHTGRQSHPSFHANNEIVSVSDVIIPGERTTRDAKTHESVPMVAPRALRTDEISAVAQQWKTSAEFALKAGFDGVEIHGANGYLIDLFLQSCSNNRTDIYGGSFENRYRFLGEVIAAVSEVFPANRIGLRINPNGGISGMGSADNDEMFKYVITQLQPLGLGYLHIMDGNAGFFSGHSLCPHLTLREVKTLFQGVVMGNTGYTKETAEEAISTGAGDLIAFGRAYISNPDLVERFANDWPLAADAPYGDWFDSDRGEKGYCDFPVYSAEVVEVVA
jgi:2,4-dienoyl-CoA reductase-like NADH-dependent reductase (Old Yellow Enzyme family)